MADLFLLVGRQRDDINADFVKSKFNKSTTVVSLHLPSYSKSAGMNKEEWIHSHFQHGINLAGPDPRTNSLTLRDVVLFTVPNPRETHLGMLQIWNSPSSVYDIDAVRIPWEEVEKDLLRRGEITSGNLKKKGWKQDSRNNPDGKNPTNFWYFSTLPGNQQPIRTLFDAPKDPNTIPIGIEAEVIQRILLAHSSPHDDVYVWSTDDDFQPISTLCNELKRYAHLIPSGTPEPRYEFKPLFANLEISRTEEPMKIEITRTSSATDTASTGSKTDESVTTVTAYIQDCRAGIQNLKHGSTSHSVTSPPYNIGYQPFNVPTQINLDGDLVAPVREGYEDDLRPEEYNDLLKTTFDGLHSKASEEAFELFLNIKSNYADSSCDLPFYMLKLMPEKWELLDVLIWRYDISYDPGRGKYKPLYEWVLRVGYGEVNRPEKGMMDWYIPILKGNSTEREQLKHPAMFPRELVRRCLKESNRHVDLLVEPFLGSGTTLATCLEEGIDAVGYELSSTYVQDIKKRLSDVKWVGQWNPKQV